MLKVRLRGMDKVSIFERSLMGGLWDYGRNERSRALGFAKTILHERT